MSDDRIKAWLDERKAIHAAASDGPCGIFYEEEDATAVVDAHNHLPAALAAIEAVLELCGEWDREADALMPGVVSDEAFKIRLLIEKALEAVIGDDQ